MSKRTSRTLALMLTVILVLQLVPKGLLVQAESLLYNPGVLTSGDTGTEKLSVSSSGEAEVLWEVKENRTENTKYFRMSDGSYRAALYAYDVHYKTEDGYEEYDNTFKTASLRGKTVYTPTKSNMNIAFASNGIQDGIFTFGEENYSVQVALVDLPVSSVISATNQVELVQKQVAATIQARDTVQTYATKLDEMTDLRKSAATISYGNVLSNTTLDYTVYGNNIKESIILSAPPVQNRWRFKLTLNGVEAELQENGDIHLVRVDSDVIECVIPKGYMFDAHNHHSDQVTYTLTPCTGGVYLTIQADAAWLNDPERVYPVTIDPTFQKDPSDSVTIQDAHVLQGNPNLNTKWYNILMAGYVSDTTFKTMRTYIKVNNLPPIPDSAELVSAVLSVRQVPPDLWYSYNSTNSYLHIGAYQVTSSWDDGTVTWNNQPTFNTDPLDYATVTSASARRFCYFDITSATRNWYENTSSNYGIVLHTEPESRYGQVSFISSNDPNVGDFQKPTMMLYYRDNRGLEDLWSYDTEAVGNAGNGYVNLYSGNLLFAQPGMTSAGDILPFNIGLVYNGAQKGMQFSGNSGDVNAPHTLAFPVKTGYGWKLNILETITLQYTEDSGRLEPWYVYHDGDGTERYYATFGADVYQSDDGAHLSLVPLEDGSFILYDDYNNKKLFDSQGRLVTIEDLVGNRKNIVYNDAGYPITVTYVPVGNETALTEFTLQYNTAGALIKVINGRDTTKYVEYLYADTYNGTAANGASKYLVEVRYSTGERATYRYGSDGKLMEATDVTNGLCVFYSYSGNKVWRIEVTRGDGLLEDERYITYQYQKTTVQTRGSDDMPLTEDDYLNVYIFDDEGRTVQNYITDLEGWTLYGAGYTDYNDNEIGTSLRKKNKVDSTVSSGKNAQNLLLNGNCESTNAWTSSVTSGGSAGVSSAYAYYGSNSLRIQLPANGGSGSYTQRVNIENENGLYTVSAYVKMEGITPLDETGGVKITVNGQSSLLISGTTDAGLGWERITATAYADVRSAIIVTLETVNCTGTVYFDAIQLEKGEAPSAYNLVQDGSFTYGNTGWTYSGTGSYGSLTGNIDSERSISQTIPLNISGKRTSLVVSGWGKGNAVYHTDNGITSYNSSYAHEMRRLGIKVVLNYSDGTSETKYVDFNINIWNDWQFASGAILPKSEDVQITSVTLSAYLSYNACTAIFENLSLIVVPVNFYEYNDRGYLTADKSASGNDQTMTYSDSDLIEMKAHAGDLEYRYDYHVQGVDSTHQIKTVTAPSGIQTNYNYNLYGRVYGQILLPYEGFQMIMQGYEYDYYGNFLKEDRNIHGTTTYNYEYATGLLNYVIDANQNRTSYLYDLSGKLTSVFADLDQDGVTDTGEQDVQYTYDAQNRLIRIDTDTTTYHFTYNDFHQTTSVRIGNQTTPLASYTYNARGGKLIRTDYADGTYITNTYNAYGRVSSVSYNGVEAYTVTYDGLGNVSYYKENASGLEYLYEYDNVGRMRQYRILSDETVLMKVVYSYTDDGRMSGISRTISGLGTQDMAVAYNHYGRIKNLTTENDTILTPTYDGYDRLIKRSVNHGGGEVHMEYEYWVSEDYTSMRISSVTFSVGDTEQFTIYYSYDGLGNITEINDGTETRLYTYDALNQMTGETIYTNATGMGTKVTYAYDQAGNLVSKTYSVYNNGTISDSTTTNYTYGDTTWGDLLTGYDGEGITYDSIGNPLSYYNGKRYTFSWDYGRRLASSIVDGKTNTYTYNMDGIRLTKTVDGVEHTYYYDGGQLIAETWGDSYLRYTYDENGTLLRVYYQNGTTTTMYYYVLNLQGDVLEIRDTANNVVCRYSYDAWGKLLSIKDGNGNAITSVGHIGNINPMRYRGYYYDTETGLYYLQSRYYDPVVGRFISPDSYISTGQGLVGYNRFVYCLNNPVILTDASGEFAGTASIVSIFFYATVAGLAAAFTAEATILIVEEAADVVRDIPLWWERLTKEDEKEDAKVEAITGVLDAPPPDDTTILYRYYASKTDNLAPRLGKDYDGLSFSTRPPRPGIKAVMTSVDAINSTGIMQAVKTSDTHYVVVPVGIPVTTWMLKGMSSIWSQVLSNIVIEME